MLKPEGYLPVEGAEPIVTRKTLNLKIKLFAAQGLGIIDDTPNCFVKCELHVESKAEVEKGEIPKGGKNKGGERKLRSSVKKSREPDWSGEPLAFDDVQEVVPALSFLRYVPPSHLHTHAACSALICCTTWGFVHELVSASVESGPLHACERCWPARKLSPTLLALERSRNTGQR